LSLLLDALRRASTVRQAPVAGIEQVREGAGDAHAMGTVTSADAGGATAHPEVAEPDAVDERDSRPVPWPAQRGDEAVAGAELTPAPRRRRWPAVAGAALLVPAALAVAGWYTTEVTRAHVASQLTGYAPAAAAPSPQSNAGRSNADPGGRRASTPRARARVTAADMLAAQHAADTGRTSSAPPEPSADEASAGPGNGDKPDTSRAGAAKRADGEQPTPTGDDGSTPEAHTAGSDDPSRDKHDGERNGAERRAHARQARIEASDATPVRDALEAGYRALQQGRLQRADRAYGRALDLAPDNRDALIGAAAVAQRQGRPGAARRLYRRVLTQDPRDAYARSALAALAGRSQRRQTESELKRLLRTNPASPALHFALGNLYAREARWSEAQRAYFEAVRAASRHPDYAYNLAVALDHLGQRNAARRHYARALDLAKQRAASFNGRAARRRLEALDGRLGEGTSGS